jgi:hypothetical protein
MRKVKVNFMPNHFKNLPVFFFFLFTGCCMIPVTRYSSSVKKNGLGVGFDLSIGRILETGINDDGSIDSTLNSQWIAGSPIFSLNIHYNRANLSTIAKAYGGGSDGSGYYLGVDYYFNPGKSSPFIGIDLATFKPPDEKWRDNFSYIGVIGYSHAFSQNSSISAMFRTGISRIKIESSQYKIPEFGLGINAYYWKGIIEISPEIFLNISHLPSGQWAPVLYPGINFGLTF